VRIPAMEQEVMRIPTDAEGIFLERPNRFLGMVQIPGEEEPTGVHVHDPGRLNEILFPGNRVLLRRAESPKRKTRWDLVAGLCEDHWVLVHSGYHRRIAEAILSSQLSPLGTVRELRAEVRYNSSRLDFLAETSKGPVWIETKGCTLCRKGVALFPDAPTTRGKRHLEHLREIRLKGERAAVLVLVFRPDAESFAPNHQTDPGFAEAFWNAVASGVEVYPLVLEFQPPLLGFKGAIPVKEAR